MSVFRILKIYFALRSTCFDLLTFFRPTLIYHLKRAPHYMFKAEIRERKNNVDPCRHQFYYLKVGSTGGSNLRVSVMPYCVTLGINVDVV